MLETFMAGFLGILSGSSLVCFLFYLGYQRERKYAEEATSKLFKMLEPDSRSGKRSGSVLSLIRADDDKPIN